MKRALRTLRQIFDLALLVLVVVVLATVLAANLGPGLGHQLIVIRGGSMEPNVHLGSTVVLSSVTPAQLHPNDVVTVKAPNGVLVTHRVVEVVTVADGTYVRLKGDANKTADPVLAPASAIQGRVEATIPLLGYLMYLLTIPTGIASIFLLAATLLLSVWLLEDLEAEEEEDEGEENAPEPQPEPEPVA